MFSSLEYQDKNLYLFYRTKNAQISVLQYQGHVFDVMQISVLQHQGHIVFEAFVSRRLVFGIAQISI